MFPVHGFEHDLAIGITIEDQRRQLAERPRGIEHGAGNLPIEQQPRDARSIHIALHGTVTDNQRDRRGKRLRDRTGERIAAAGDEGDLNPRADRVVNGVDIGLRDLPACVEQRAVNVDGDESDPPRP